MKKLTALTMLVLLAAAWSTVAFAATKEQEARVAIAQAETAVEAAENADASTSANVELRAARDNLTAARGASERRKWGDSVLNAQKAAADAGLASARSRQARATAATSEIEASLETLRQQLTQPGN